MKIKDDLKFIARQQSGLSVLLVVVIISAVILTISQSASLSGLNGIETAYAFDRADEALVLAEGCGEETLERFKLNNDYEANDFTLAYGNGQCIINTVIDGSHKIINIVASIDKYYQRLLVDITISENEIILNNWQPVNE
jgi:hypothetical protein